MRIIVALIAIFLVLVFFNLIRPNIKAAADTKEMKANVIMVDKQQTADAATIEEQVRVLDARDLNKNTDEMKILYRKMFSTSVILGDSLTEGLSVYGWLPESVVFAKVGGSIVYGDDIFDRAAMVHPKYAFFAYGMNDMGNYGGNSDNFIDKYTTLLKKFHKTSPETVIAVNSITTPTDAAIQDNSSIGHYKEFNEAIKKMCKKEHYIYIDITDILPSHPEWYARDGIHAAPAYYPLWMDRMIEFAGLTL